jgi:hypothetical protein
MSENLSFESGSKSAERRLFCDLVACGLLKADADWDEKHPRTGSPPNRADGRRAIWHAQSAKGYRGLKERARQLGITYLQFVFDPN